MGVRVLVVGAGSIGKRHIRALKTIEVHEIAALRSLKGSTRDLDEDLKDTVLEFFNSESAFNWKPTHLIISNPTNLHVDYLRKGIEYECMIFVEKPVVGSFQQLVKSDPELLENLKKVEGQVGFNLRFSRLFKAVNKLIIEQRLGRMIFAHMEVGHYLPKWHPYEDYRRSYSARKDLGGGVLRTLSHELDLASLFFGEFKQIFAKVEKLSHLDIDVDDCVNIIGRTSRCERVSIHLNYLYPSPVRSGKIVGEKGILKYDFFNKHITIEEFDKNQVEKLEIQEDDYQQQYIDQMYHFINGDTSICCSLSDGLRVDELIEICEKSSNENKAIYV